MQVVMASWIFVSVLAFSVPLVHGEIATANNQLALKLYYHLSKSTDGDFLFSPFSLSTLISVLGSIAGQTTENRITLAMEYHEDYQAVTNDFKRILTDFKKFQSLSLSSLELQQKDDLKLSAEFRQVLMKYLFDIGPLKFSTGYGKNGNKEDAYMSTIVKLGNRTHNDIDQLLQLKSTLNFKGSWSTPFNPIYTRPSPFYNMSRRPYLVDMMFQRMNVPFAEIEALDCTGVALPYKLNYTAGIDAGLASRLQLLIFLPNSITGLYNLETRLVQQPFSITMREFRETKDLFVYLPRFHLSSELDLKLILKQMGLESIFLSDSSDFSKTFLNNETRRKTGQFGVLKAFHFGKFSVDEFGTNGWDKGALVAQPAINKHISPEVFRVDRPFVGVLYDTERNVALTMFRKIEFESIDPNKIAIPDALLETKF